MKGFFEENRNNSEFGVKMLNVPEEPKLNSYSKPLDSFDFYPRSQKEIGKMNEKLEQMYLKF